MRYKRPVDKDGYGQRLGGLTKRINCVLLDVLSDKCVGSDKVSFLKKKNAPIIKDRTTGLLSGATVKSYLDLQQQRGEDLNNDSRVGLPVEGVSSSVPNVLLPSCKSESRIGFKRYDQMTPLDSDPPSVRVNELAAFRITLMKDSYERVRTIGDFVEVPTFSSHNPKAQASFPKDKAVKSLFGATVQPYLQNISPMIGSPASSPEGDLTDMFGTKSSFWPPPWSLLILAAIIGLGYCINVSILCDVYGRGSTLLSIDRILIHLCISFSRLYYNNDIINRY